MQKYPSLHWSNQNETNRPVSCLVWSDRVPPSWSSQHWQDFFPEHFQYLGYTRKVNRSIFFQFLQVTRAKSVCFSQNCFEENSAPQALCSHRGHTWLPSSFPWPWAWSRVMMLWCSGRTGGIWLLLFLLSFWRGFFWHYSISFCITTLYMKTEFLRNRSLGLKTKKTIYLLLPLKKHLSFFL